MSYNWYELKLMIKEAIMKHTDGHQWIDWVKHVARGKLSERTLPKKELIVWLWGTAVIRAHSRISIQTHINGINKVSDILLSRLNKRNVEKVTALSKCYPSLKRKIMHAAQLTGHAFVKKMNVWTPLPIFFLLIYENKSKLYQKFPTKFIL